MAEETQNTQVVPEIVEKSSDLSVNRVTQMFLKVETQNGTDAANTELIKYIFNVAMASKDDLIKYKDEQIEDLKKKRPATKINPTVEFCIYAGFVLLILIIITALAIKESTFRRPLFILMTPSIPAFISAKFIGKISTKGKVPDWLSEHKMTVSATGGFAIYLLGLLLIKALI